MKKWLSLLLMVSMVMLLAACGGGNDYEEPEEYVEDEEVIEEDELDEPEVDPEIGILRSDVYPDDQMWFLLRDDKTYSLGTVVHMVDGIDYSSAGSGSTSDNSLVVYQTGRMLAPSGLTGICSFGDVPVPVLGENDLVVSYSDSSVPTLGLHSMLYSGDAVYFDYDSNLNTLLFYDAEGHEGHFETGADSADVTDEDGNSVSDWCDLERDKYYTVSWYEGTQYYEYSMKAESKFYDDDENDLSVAYRFEPEYEIEGERTKNGYATYDLSDIPAGIYCIVDPETLIHGGLIEIE